MITTRETVVLLRIIPDRMNVQMIVEITRIGGGMRDLQAILVGTMMIAAKAVVAVVAAVEGDATTSSVRRDAATVRVVVSLTKTMTGISRLLIDSMNAVVGVILKMAEVKTENSAQQSDSEVLIMAIHNQVSLMYLLLHYQQQKQDAAAEEVLI